jgi:hypothetical protein
MRKYYWNRSAGGQYFEGDAMEVAYGPGCTWVIIKDGRREVAVINLGPGESIAEMTAASVQKELHGASGPKAA